MSVITCLKEKLSIHCSEIIRLGIAFPRFDINKDFGSFINHIKHPRLSSNCIIIHREKKQLVRDGIDIGKVNTCISRAKYGDEILNSRTCCVHKETARLSVAFGKKECLATKLIKIMRGGVCIPAS